MDKSKYSRTYFDLLEALPQQDCAVCRLVNDAIHHYIDIFIYENINNLARRDEIRQSRGFCSLHMTMFMSGYGRLLSLAMLEQDILNDVLRQIGQPAAAEKPGLLKALFQSGANGLREAILPRRGCPLCEYERSQEKVVLGTLIQFAEDPEMQGAFANSAGLCLPHFYIALDMPGKLERIIDVELDVLKRLKTDIDAYVHKRNPSYSGEPMGEEASAPTRAAKAIAGRVVHTDGRY